MEHEIEQLLEQLTTLINDGFSLGRSKCVLDREKLLDLIDEIKAEFPAELEQARNITAAKNEIIGTAKREAEAIKRAAEERARQMVSNESVVAAARQKANEMVAAAEQKTKELRLSTNKYVSDVFDRTEESLSTVLAEIKEVHGNFKKASK